MQKKKKILSSKQSYIKEGELESDGEKLAYSS